MFKFGIWIWSLEFAHAVVVAVVVNSSSNGEIVPKSGIAGDKSFGVYSTESLTDSWKTFVEL